MSHESLNATRQKLPPFDLLTIDLGCQIHSRTRWWFNWSLFWYNGKMYVLECWSERWLLSNAVRESVWNGKVDRPSRKQRQRCALRMEGGRAHDGLVCEEGGSAVANWFSFPKQRWLKPLGTKERENEVTRVLERAEKRRDDISYANCERGREGSLQYDSTNNQDAQFDPNPNIMSCDTKKCWTEMIRLP